MSSFRQAIIAIVTFISGLYFFLEFILPKKFLGITFGAYHQQILEGVQVVGIMAIGLGIINIIQVHGTRVIRNQRSWGYSLVLILGFFSMLSVGGWDFLNAERSVRSWKVFNDYVKFVEQINKDFAEREIPALPRLQVLKAELEKRLSEVESPEINNQLKSALAKCQHQIGLLISAYSNSASSPEQRKVAIDESSLALISELKATLPLAKELAELNYKSNPVNKASNLMFSGLFVPLNAAMFSLLAFYIAAAAYRSFRIRSIEASVLMIVAVLVILGQIPQGPMYISENLPAVRLWFLEYVNAPGFRAIYFSTAIAGLAMAVRMWLSLERSPLADDD